MIHSYNNAIPSIDSILGMSCPEIGFLRQTPSPFSDSETDDDLAILSHPSSHSQSFFDSNETGLQPAPQVMRSPIPSSSDSAPISQPQSVALVPVVKTELQPESVKEKVVVKKEMSSLKFTDLKTVKAAEKFVKQLDEDELQGISKGEIQNLDDNVQEVIKKARRRLQNRNAAQTSRIKKKQQLEKLQQEVQKLIDANKKFQGLPAQPDSSLSVSQPLSLALVPAVKTEPLDEPLKTEVEVKPEAAQEIEKKPKKERKISKKQNNASAKKSDLKAAKAAKKISKKKLDPDVQEAAVKERKKLKNRNSAQAYREKKKQQFEKLQQEVQRLTEENKNLYAKIQELSVENEKLKAQAATS